MFLCQKVIILEQSKKDPKKYIRLGDLDRDGNFLSVTFPPSSLLSTFMHSDTQSITIGS
jgi:hypothetical protein